MKISGRLSVIAFSVYDAIHSIYSPIVLLLIGFVLQVLYVKSLTNARNGISLIYTEKGESKTNARIYCHRRCKTDLICTSRLNDSLYFKVISNTRSHNSC